MKHIAGTVLRTAACAVVLVTGVALLAGKDDIRKFRQMCRDAGAVNTPPEQGKATEAEGGMG